ncbi:MAG: B12-binding domain-containing radical SAM protein [Planctomycetota bacterium]|jgi:radical SAM superfamily enzyme YgiQ (UPF0313 family)
MCNNPVLFVAFEEQDNLGVGYLASVLSRAAFDIRIIDFRLGKQAILNHIIRYGPLVVGFSIIFQYHIYDFKDLITFLRERGVNCHFTAGGHYPSLRYAELLDIIPALDSVVLFEGEHTLLDLVRSIYAGKQWKRIKGIAYKNNNAVVVNPLRPLERDLDRFPPPVRQPLKEYALGKKYATLLAGRGCYYNCSFCSIRQFYSKPPGPLKRIRRPEMVVREMQLLHRQLDCSVFMFQDDDFPVAGPKGTDWVTRFCQSLAREGLADKVLWKISCRPDEVRADTFRLMRDAGLFLVYLGIEDGTDDGLRLMDKRTTAQENVKAADTLKELGIRYDFGFMLFHPSATSRSIMDNLAFLQKLCGDGSSPVTFCKMLPYAETKVEYELRKRRRLKGRPGFEDYDFIETPLNYLYSFAADSFEDWIGKHDGLLNIARWARYYLSVYRKYFPITPPFRAMDKTVNEVISQSNIFFIDTLRMLLHIYSAKKPEHNAAVNLPAIRKEIAARHSRYKSKLTEVLNRTEAMAESKGTPRCV